MSYSSTDNELKFTGTFVNEPCEVSIGGSGAGINVDFGTVPEKNFYNSSSDYAWSEKFSILLKNCDLSIGTQVKVTFAGVEDLEQPGALAINSNNGISHVAIIILDSKGNKLLVNTQSDSYLLSAGNTSLSFVANLKASRDGVKNKTVGSGSFNSVATFVLEYS
jgi:type 1 fimbria pilin